jgi:hypothetical protein
MKLQSFVYKDLKGKVSNRQVLVVQEPSDKVMGIDVTEADDETVVNFALAYEALRSSFLAEVSALQRSYDLQHRYRTFFLSSMDEVVLEEI